MIEFVSNLFPMISVHIQDMMRYLNWTRAAILYEDEFGLVRLQDLVRTPPTKNLELYIRQTNPENYRLDCLSPEMFCRYNKQGRSFKKRNIDVGQNSQEFVALNLVAGYSTKIKPNLVTHIKAKQYLIQLFINSKVNTSDPKVIVVRFFMAQMFVCLLKLLQIFVEKTRDMTDNDYITMQFLLKCRETLFAVFYFLQK